MTSVRDERQMMGPKCRLCRNTEATCARTYPCCDRCSHLFGEPVPDRDELGRLLRVFACASSSCTYREERTGAGRLKEVCPRCQHRTEARSA